MCSSGSTPARLRAFLGAARHPGLRRGRILEVSAAVWTRAGKEGVFRVAPSPARPGSCPEGGRPEGRQRLRSARCFVQREGQRTWVCAWAEQWNTRRVPVSRPRTFPSSDSEVPVLIAKPGQDELDPPGPSPSTPLGKQSTTKDGHPLTVARGGQEAQLPAPRRLGRPRG